MHSFWMVLLIPAAVIAGRFTRSRFPNPPSAAPPEPLDETPNLQPNTTPPDEATRPAFTSRWIWKWARRGSILVGLIYVVVSVGMWIGDGLGEKTAFGTGMRTIHALISATDLPIVEIFFATLVGSVFASRIRRTDGA